MTLAFRAFVLTLALVPDCFAEFMANLAGSLSASLPSRRLRIIRLNVEKVLGLPARTSFARSFNRQVFRSQFLCLVDTCREAVRPGSVFIEDLAPWQQVVHSMESKGRPIIFVLAHIGSWEISGTAITRSCARNVQALAKLPKVQGAAQVLEWIRHRMGVNVLWTHKKSLVRDMMETLRAGNHLVMVVDQKPEGRVGDTVQFLGFPVAFVSGPATMSLRCNAAIISVATVRTGPRRFRVLGKLVHDPADPSAPKSEAEISQLCANEIERWIRLYPEQWTWEYKRWVFAS